MTVALMACYITVNAQTEPKFKPSIDQLYLTVDEVPNAVYWLPAPPEPGSTQFTHDINQYYWGQSRVIAGYHWQSDVDASRMLAAACYARLHACEAFVEDMAAARKEFQKLKKANK